jgi:hypothetical protein
LNAIALPKISINSEINAQTNPPFLARVTVDEIRPGKFVETAPFQWVIAVKPFKFPVKGNGFVEYIKIKPKALAGEISDNSQLGMHMAAFKSIFSDVNANIGDGEYIGKVAWFQKSVFKYPPNKDGEQFQTTLTVPVREATAEELEEIGEDAPASATSLQLSADEVEKILTALDGKAKGQFQKAMFTTREPKLISAVVSGTALDYLVEQGLASISEDGTFSRI